jgi:hypothetical protein
VLVLVVVTFAIKVTMAPGATLGAELVRVVVVLAMTAVIVKVTGAAELVLKLASPLYEATIEWFPGVENATPDAVNASPA